MNKLTTIYVVRHGESEGNVGLYEKEAHELGSPLTQNGKNQARMLADNLKHIEFSAIFSSDLLRAKQTAEIIALNKKLEVETSNLIRERNFWHYAKKINEKTEETIREEIKIDLLKLNELEKRNYKYTKDMESSDEGAIRLLNFIRECAIAYEGKTILIVAHGNIMRSLLTHLGYAIFDELPEGAINNTGYFKLESDGVDFFIKETSNVNIKKGAVRNY
jgi:broad specificity phosphatase PhoE